MYDSEEGYVEALTRRSMLPDGFRAGTVGLEFTPAEKSVDVPYAMNVSAVTLDLPTSLFAGRLTRNLFPGAPIHIARRRLDEPDIQGILVNNRISNVCVPSGEQDANELLEAFAASSGLSAQRLIPASTGIIGWGLPVTEMKASLPQLVQNMQSETILEVARAIMTTDLFPKVRSAEVGGGRVVGIAKGAGMIEPNMGTMLVFLFTDVLLSRDEMRRIHADVVEETFNRISIDGDQSTSDMAILLSSGIHQAPDAESFRRGLFSVCRSLAEDIVRNGEGTSHVIRVMVRNAPESKTAVALGKAVVNSPLVKTAVFGDDPNVGRIVMAAGDYLGNAHPDFDASALSVSIGGHRVFAGGSFCIGTDAEETISRHLQAARLDPDNCKYPVHEHLVDIELDLARGAESAEVLGSDLSYGYVRENADYRT
jgi:glutamate N-acetyltransferase / amino-acid N-acetyltransferase